MEKVLKSGVGWRIGWNPTAEKYKGLVGSDEWAIELTEAELNDFCRLLGQLSETMDEMARVLMEEERIATEVESELLWMEVEGFAHSYSLRMIVKCDRSCEGNWAEFATKELVQATQTLKIF